MVRRNNPHQRTQVLAAAQALLAQPAPAMHWQHAMEEARQFTALLGMQPEVRRPGGRILEVSVISQGTRYTLQIGEIEITRGAVRKQRAEAAGTPWEAQDDDDATWLWEEELAAILRVLELEEGWSWKKTPDAPSSPRRYEDRSRGKYPHWGILPLGKRKGYLVVRVITRVDASQIEEYEEITDLPAMPLNAAKRKLEELVQAQREKDLVHMAEPQRCRMLEDVYEGMVCPGFACWLVKGTAMCYPCLEQLAKTSTSSMALLAPALAQHLFDLEALRRARLVATVQARLADTANQIPVRCACGEVESRFVPPEDRANYLSNEDGTYRLPGNRCVECLRKEAEAQANGVAQPDAAVSCSSDEFARQQNMVHTIGYLEPDAQERITAFLAQPNTALVDIRQKPASRRAQWNLPALVKRYAMGEQVQYGHCPQLGNLHYPQLPAVLANKDEGVRLVLSLVYSGLSVMLLCACAEYVECHRKEVWEAVQDRLLQDHLSRERNNTAD